MSILPNPTYCAFPIIFLSGLRSSNGFDGSIVFNGIACDCIDLTIFLD